MVKTKSAPVIGGMGTWDEITTIRECKNLVRWNAPLAIQFMEYASGRVCNMSSLVIKEYNKDSKKKYGSDSNVAIQKFSQFIAKVEYDKASPEILNFCFSFLKDLKNVSNNPKSAQKLIKIIEKSLFTD